MNNPGKQHGSFLLTVMIVMLIMVFSGLMVMETAMFEEVSVGNEQRTVEVYQVAYSELENQLTFLEANPIHFNRALGGNRSLSVIGNPGGCSGGVGKICQKVTLRYINDAPPPPGYSLERNISRVFELDSVATLNGSGARSSQTLGIIYVDVIPGS